MPNGVTSTYTYDGMGRLKRLKHENGSSTLYDDQYTYNPANQISEIAGLSQTRDYTYDNINRLAAETDGTTSESYTYDAVGNRTASHLSGSYTTGSFNRVTATSSASYSYNSNGSTTGKTVGSTGWTYGWDRENRMVSTTDGTNSVSYAYDALGRRVKRTQGSDVQKYTHDGNDIVLDDINSTLTKYQNAPGIDNKLKYVTGGTSKYFLQDHLGSTAGIVDSGGSVTDSNSYDSFGNASNGSFTSRYQFTGRENDPLTGLQFNRARFYDQNLGRFTSEDPIGFLGGDFNLYGYTKNSPLRAIDPMGRDIVGIAVGGSGGIGAHDGVAASGSTMYGFSGPGIFSDGQFDAGTASSYGVYSSCGCQKDTGEVWGAGGGLGISLVGSNARSFSDHAGPFQSNILGVSIFSLQIDTGTASDGTPITVVQIGVSPTPLSIGRFHYSYYCTETPDASIGTVSGLGRNLAQGINELYGSPYR